MFFAAVLLPLFYFMRYVDIGTLPQQNQTNFRRERSVSPRSRKSSGRRLWKSVSWLVFMGLLLFGVYSFLPPIKDAVAGMFSGSSAVFSYLVNGEQELKQSGGKTNVLLMGIDKRADEAYEFRGSGGIISKNGFRTDSIILASYNYDSKRVTMLSIPRDLWVDVPAFGEVEAQSMKINGVYAVGDMYNYPGGGQALLGKVISEVLGVPIHYSARIDFAGFEKAIDSVGGIDVVVKNAFVDYEYPIEGKENAWPMSARYKTLKFKAGLQHMDGQTALEFARSRHAAGPEGTDFARAARQQLVIAAFKDKVFSPDTIKSPQALIQLYKSLGESFATTAKVEELPTAYELAQTINTSTMKTYNLDDRADNVGGLLYAPPVNEFGAYVLLPDDGTFAEVRQFVQQIFSSGGLKSEENASDAGDATDASLNQTTTR